MTSITFMSSIGLLCLLYLLYHDGRKRSEARAKREPEAALKRAGL